MSLPPALSLSDEARITVTNFLRKKFSDEENGCCFFRRFNTLFASKNNLIEIIDHFGPHVSQTLSSLEGISPEKMKKSIELKYKKFAGFTLPKPIRDEPDEYNNTEIYIHSDNYCQVDLTLDYTFEFNKVRALCSPVTPQHGDLIFVFISNKKASITANNSDKPLKPRADYWCIVSEQFLHAWTLINYDWHESFDKLIASTTPVEKRETALRQKIFSGNRLMTNSWLKYNLSMSASGKTITAEESKERYWFLRTEYASRKWVDIYAAIVLVARYGELPCPVNVPNSKIDDCSRSSWNLPETFMSMFLQKSLGDLCIIDHLINYDKWISYSDTSVMFSFYNKGKVKGFFDDIPTVKLNQSTVIKTNTDRYISNIDFPTIIEVKSATHVLDDRTWAKLVSNNSAPIDENTFVLQINAKRSTEWAEIAQIDSDDW